jgi:uncharacterized membrane protein
MSEEFFIGWQGKAPEKTGRFLKRLTIAGILVALGLAAALPALQKTVSQEAKFDYGNLQEFSGVLLKEPVPLLLGDDHVLYFLVNPFKYGFDLELAEKHNLQRVSLKGTRIHRGDQEMIEVVPETVAPMTKAPGMLWSSASYFALPGWMGGETTLRGEIVDSKCYLGVMNPGNLKAHRACAINCIQGGIPPVLLVRDGEGRASYVLLVKEDGSPLNADILDLVAEPISVTGQLKRQGKLLILFANPDRFSRE